MIAEGRQRRLLSQLSTVTVIGPVIRDKGYFNSASFYKKQFLHNQYSRQTHITIKLFCVPDSQAPPTVNNDLLKNNTKLVRKLHLEQFWFRTKINWPNDKEYNFDKKLYRWKVSSFILSQNPGACMQLLREVEFFVIYLLLISEHSVLNKTYFMFCRNIFRGKINLHKSEIERKKVYFQMRQHLQYPWPSLTHSLTRVAKPRSTKINPNQP